LLVRRRLHVWHAGNVAQDSPASMFRLLRARTLAIRPNEVTANFGRATENDPRTLRETGIQKQQSGRLTAFERSVQGPHAAVIGPFLCLNVGHDLPTVFRWH